MPTKTIAHTYLSGGYNLSPGYGTLAITPTGTIGGSGVQAAASATIDNLGIVRESGSGGQGIVLYEGGKVTNGSGADTRALIEGYVAVSAVTLAATVTNFGTIEATGTAGPAIGFDKGGRVTNGTTADTTALISGSVGVSIGAVAATVTNFGTIQATGPAGLAIALYGGGRVTNGSTADTDALIAGYIGVRNETASTTVSNFGTIRATGTAQEAIALGDGRLNNFGVIVGKVSAYNATIVNGSKSGGSPLIYGVVVGQSVLNYGTITGSYSASTLLIEGGVRAQTLRNLGKITGVNAYGVNAYTVFNGGSTDSSAVISGPVTGKTVFNYATLSGSVDAVYEAINGSAGNTVASMSGGILVGGHESNNVYYNPISLPVSRLTNFGTISATASVAVAILTTYSLQGFRGGWYTQILPGTIFNGSSLDTSALIIGGVEDGIIGSYTPGYRSPTRHGTIVNYGTIESGSYGVVCDGGIVNGTSSDTVALIQGAVVFNGSLGSAINLGTINGSIQSKYGGSFVNGSTSDSVALVTGLVEVPNVTNYGTIGSPGTGLSGQFSSLSNGASTDPNALMEVMVSGVTAGLVDNFGTINAALGSGGQSAAPLTCLSLTNGSSTDTTALIEGFSGIVALGSGATAINYGAITGLGTGVLHVDTITNGSDLDPHATLYGHDQGVSYAETIVNDGTIWGQTGAAIYQVTDLANGDAGDTSALIHGGVYLAGSITNFGTITAGPHGTAVLLTGRTAVLVVEAHSVIQGTVYGATGTLALAGTAGAIGGLGTQFTDFNLVEVEAGARWTLSGKNTVPGLRLIDDGTLSNLGSFSGGIRVDGGYLWNGVGRTVTNAGVAVYGLAGARETVANMGVIVSANSIAVELAGHGTVTNGAPGVSAPLMEGKTGVVLQGSGTVANFGTIDGTGGIAVDFLGTSDVLKLGGLSVLKGDLAGFGATDRIDLVGFAFGSGETVGFVENGAKTAGTLTVTDGSRHRSVELLGQFAAAGFHLSADHHGGSFVGYTSPPTAPPTLAPPGV